MIRFYNGLCLSFAGGMEVTGDEVWVDGDKISYVGPARTDMPEFQRQIDLNGDLVMPGFKDAHTHSGMTFLRSYADDLPLQRWLYERVFPMEEKLNPDYIYWLTRLAILEYLTSGITASFDMYFHRDAYASANIDSGFRTVICGVGGTAQLIEDEYRHFNSLHPLISYVPGFHAEYTASQEQLDDMAAVARELKAPVFVHNSETESEVQGCIERHGMTPTCLFDKLGIYDYGGGGYHCVYMSEEDLKIFKERGLWAVTNPASNCKLASGIAPITHMMDLGLNLAIGTDGPASNNALDMFREMYLTTVLQKLRNMDAAACDANEVLKMAVTGGAGAMGLTDCDCIAPGKQADLIVIDMHRPNMQPVHNVTKNMVYAGSKDNVRMTVIAGRVLYEKGEFFVGEDVERIYAEAARIVGEIKGEG
ncbi:MAG: amidohydrolase [Oscillospiraceae bacterium]|nr:amidohydrolase [Oscillospiraceae bacterium]